MAVSSLETSWRHRLVAFDGFERPYLVGVPASLQDETSSEGGS